MAQLYYPLITDALSAGWPDVVWECRGDTDNYSNITAIAGALPAELEVREHQCAMTRTTVIRHLSEICEEYIMAGFVSDALGSPYFYDAQIVDQINLIGSFLMAAGGMDVPYACRSMATGEKEYHIHTAAQMTAVVGAGAQWKLFYLNKFHAKRQYILGIPFGENAFDLIRQVTWDSVE